MSNYKTNIQKRRTKIMHDITKELPVKSMKENNYEIKEQKLLLFLSQKIK